MAREMTELPVSVLDQVHVLSGTTARDSFALMSAYAAHAEELGLRRFWVAEHHASRGIASVAPPVLIARLSAETKSIRVGAGGVMLPNHSPLVVAEQFASLAALAPERIDLGIGRGPGTADPEVAALLRRGGPVVTDEGYAAGIAETLGYLGTHSAALGSLSGFAPSPWLLASSESGARLAARFGLPLSFAHHIRPSCTRAAIALYRSEFRPSRWLDRPYVMLGVMAICADTDERANELALPFKVLISQFSKHESAPVLPLQAAAAFQLADGDGERLRAVASAQAIGAPDTVRHRIASLVAAEMPDELMLVTPVHDIHDRLRSLDLVVKHAVRPRSAKPARI